MAFFVVFNKSNTTQLSVVNKPSEIQLNAEGFKRASRKVWGFRRNANFYARHLSSTFNLSTLGGQLFPLD